MKKNAGSVSSKKSNRKKAKKALARIKARTWDAIELGGFCGAVVACSPPGEDGELQIQVSW